jgi:DNA-binding GntR family transcriptional regulator
MPQPTLNEWIYRKVREAIIEGQLLPGTQLNENALAAKFSTSSTPVRETLARLDQEGYIVIQPRRGRFVKRFDKKTIEDLFEARIMLETKAVERVVPTLREQVCAKLGAMVAVAQEKLIVGDVDGYQQQDRIFHRKLVFLLGNDLVSAMCTDVWDKLRWVRNVLPPTAKDFEIALTGHRQIMDAIRARDGVNAARILERHIDHVRSSILEAYEGSPYFEEALRVKSQKG